VIVIVFPAFRVATTFVGAGGVVQIGADSVDHAEVPVELDALTRASIFRFPAIAIVTVATLVTFATVVQVPPFVRVWISCPVAVPFDAVFRVHATVAWVSLSQASVIFVGVPGATESVGKASEPVLDPLPGRFG
jgi:hypothetical protein